MTSKKRTRKCASNGGINKMKNLGKKISTIVVLAIFMLSIVPVAFAEDATTAEATTAAEAEAEATTNKIKTPKGLLKATKDKWKEVRRHAEFVKEEQIKARNAVKLQKERLTELKTKLKGCKETNTCVEKKIEIKENKRKISKSIILQFIKIFFIFIFVFSPNIIVRCQRSESKSSPSQQVTQ